MRYRPICRNIEYARVYRRGKSYVAPKLVLYVCKNRLGRTRVGFTATKKVGHAVQRNRARRAAAVENCRSDGLIPDKVSIAHFWPRYNRLCAYILGII